MKEPTLASMKEAGIIDALARHLDGTGMPQGWTGIGDDAAVTAVPAGERTLTTVDVLVEDVHFRRASSSAADIAWKAMAVNVSDIRAMGGKPLWAVLGLSLPSDLEAGWCEAFAAGLGTASRHFGLPVVGGDTTRSPGPIVVSLTLVGSTSRPMLRSTARPGDRIVASGAFGWAAAGLWCLEHPESRIPEALRRRAESAQRRPEPATLPPFMVDLPHLALMDDSDGLSASLVTLAEASGVALVARDEALDGDRDLETLAAHAGVPVRTWQLGGGEDYGLVACVPPGSSLPPGWRDLGQVEAGRGAWLASAEGRRRLRFRGWDHFPTDRPRPRHSGDRDRSAP